MNFTNVTSTRSESGRVTDREKQRGIRMLIPLKWHVLSWLVFIASYAVYRYKIAGEAYGDNVDFVIFMVYHVVLFYANALWVLPLAFRNKKKLWYRFPLYLFLEVTGILCVVIMVSMGMGGLEISLDSSQPWQLTIINFFLVILPLFYSLILSVAFYGLRWGILQYAAYHRAKGQNSALMNAVEVHRQDWRKAQLNPHLLFDLLTMLRYITSDTPREAVRAMNILIRMMRYYIDSSPQGMILLSEEMQQVNHLIELNTIRFERKPSLELTAVGPLEGIRVIPMLVLLLVENIFNHGVFLDENHPAVVSIRMEQKQFHVHAENRISSEKRGGLSGNGLKNLEERLEHFYPGRHFFHYREAEGVFLVDLLIDNR